MDLLELLEAAVVLAVLAYAWARAWRLPAQQHWRRFTGLLGIPCGAIVFLVALFGAHEPVWALIAGLLAILGIAGEAANARFREILAEDAARESAKYKASRDELRRLFARSADSENEP